MEGALSMTKFKKILFISYDGMTDPLGQSQVIPYLKGLTKYGYIFTILSCDKPNRYESQHQYVKDLIKGYPIEWISIPYHKKPPIVSSLYDWLALRRKAKQLDRTHSFDMVHTRSGLGALVGLYMKRKYGLKFLNDIRGFWADERIDGGIWNIKNPIYKTIYRFFKKKEKACLIEADYNVCLTSAAKKEIHSWKYIPNQPVSIEVIPCSVDLELFDPSKIDSDMRQTFKKELQIEEQDFIISYLGSLGGWYLTEEMMRFCRKLADEIPNAKFLFISPNASRDILKEAKTQNIDSSKIITKYAHRHEVPALLSFSKYSIFFIKPCYSKIASSPTKHGEIMSMGIPIITNSGVGDMQEIVEQSKGGYVAKDYTDDSFNPIISQIKNGVVFHPEDIRSSAYKVYALETAVQRYRQVYKTILG